MSLAQYIAESVITESRPVAELCRNHGVSRSWVYELVGRYRQFGPEGLAPRSKAPKRCPRRTPEQLRAEIVEIRKTLGRGGLYNGAESIIDELENRGYRQIPSARTIHRIISKAGLVKAQPQKRPRSAIRRFAAELPNECWQTDVTHYGLADGSYVDIVNFLDDHSRFIIASVVLGQPSTATDIAEIFRTATEIYGNPASVLSDNGATYTAKYRGGRVVLEDLLGPAGIVFKHGRPFHPQTQGKVERFHQTLKKWLKAQPQPETVAELQALIDIFISYYNYKRKHRGIGRATPWSVYCAKIKATPSGPTTETHYRVRHDQVNAEGKVTLRYRSKLLHLGIGRRHSGTVVKILVADRDVRVITLDGELIGRHTLNATRNYHRNELGDSAMF